MTRNVSKLVIRLSNYGILVSFCALLVASAIDVVPDKQIILEVFFYFFLPVYCFVGYSGDNDFLSDIRSCEWEVR
jgi:hypothetical protein